MVCKFKDDFIWGAATSSFQIEGAHDADGKSESIWDRFCTIDGTIEDKTDGKVACDHYHKMEEDVDLMAELGLKAYRFSIAWPRIIPNGVGEVEPRGIAFYNRLIDKLIEKNIEPVLTLYHWDLPQVLQDKGGWANREIVYWFEEYAKVVVNAFGDRVKKWNTINEPMVITKLGYLNGVHAPGLKDEELCFKAIHNVNLAQTKAYKVLKEYNSNFEIGVAQALFANEPEDENDPVLVDFVEKANDASLWIYLDPIIHGTYPESVLADIVKYNGDIVFEDLKEMKNTADFIGVNLYSRNLLGYVNGNIEKIIPEGAGVTDIGWEVAPDAMYNMLVLLKEKYNNMATYITENGASYHTGKSEDGKIYDIERENYFRGYISSVHRAIQEGCDVKGYFAWSLMDNFEWALGYSQRFGIVYVDYETQERTIKESGHFYASIIKNGGF